jgi:hypothetical protein
LIPDAALFRQVRTVDLSDSAIGFFLGIQEGAYRRSFYHEHTYRLAPVSSDPPKISRRTDGL